MRNTGGFAADTRESVKKEILRLTSFNIILRDVGETFLPACRNAPIAEGHRGDRAKSLITCGHTLSEEAHAIEIPQPTIAIQEHYTK